MARSNGAGPWMFIGGLVGLLLVQIAEFLYEGYSVSDNYISDLGVGPSPSKEIFALGLILFGASAIVSSFILRKQGTTGRLWMLLAIAGVGSIGVALFDEHSFLVNGLPVVHTIAAILAFLFGNAAAIYSSRVARSTLSIVWIVMGGIGLVALVLYIMASVNEAFLMGLGVGGMERLIFYPAVLWAISFGTALMASERPLHVYRGP